MARISALRVAIQQRDLFRSLQSDAERQVYRMGGYGPRAATAEAEAKQYRAAVAAMNLIITAIVNEASERQAAQRQPARAALGVTG